ncbi:MAG TPA: divergent PAP2 family protein [Spirochaetia bacterium]|nr:divergent PAP2 family protein [Spirochaetia bacterium]
MIFDVLPKSLILALGIQLSCQGFKFVAASVRTRTLSWGHLTTPGGMPSAHSAFVTALAVCIGVFSGFTSDLFALAAVFGGIVIFDAYKLRGNVQKQAVVVNRLQSRALPEGEQVKINEMVGHTLPEIVAGIAWALVIAFPAAFVLK